jgi:hypothetical protein
MEELHFIDDEPDRYQALLELEKRSIESMNVEQIIGTLEIFENAWDLRRSCHRNARELGYRQFIHKDHWDHNGEPLISKIDIRAIKGIKDRQRRYLLNLRTRMGVLNIKNKPDEDGITLLKRINSVGKQLKDGFDNVRRHWNAFERVVNPTAEPLISCFSDPLAMDEDEVEKCSPYQKCIIHSLEEAHRQGLRRYHDSCYEEIRSPSGYGTRAWKPKFEIIQFVYSLAPKDDEFENWKNFTSKGGCYKDVANHLTNCYDPQFPAIEKRRHVWSFRNGVFCGKEDGPQNKGHPTCKFYPYDSHDFHVLDPSIISCKYFDQDFIDFSHIDDWFHIPTPNFDTILQYQGFEEDVQKWAYVMGGRLCYDVGELDKWQVIPFMKGIARSGKSTLINNVFQRFYQSEDVKTLGNNIERKFGLSAIKDALMFVAPEVKGDLALEQAEFQSLVSGEGIAINVKNKTAQSLPNWKVPGILGGNEVPNWNDKSGSVLRRILPWNFTKQVQEADPNLDKKLAAELPAILCKCIRGYLEYSEKYSGRDIWNVVPPYFKIIQNQVAMVANTLHHFLNSVRVIKEEGKFVPEDIFHQAYNSHCARSLKGKKPDLFNPDFYIGPFSTYGITVKTCAINYKGREYPAQPVFFGVDVIEEELMIGNNH